MLLEMKSELSENDRQSALRMSKKISNNTADFKAYHFSIVDQITAMKRKQGRNKRY